MKIEKIREMTEVELVNEVKKLKTELFNLRFQQVTGQLENPLKMRDVKKDIARVKTIIREKELEKTDVKERRM
ncbi:MAG TPA: 50S ribosomal protein L29 [Clostridiales bacterium]|jgi:large subunit ribosomal protein L29|nr:50S ribosomal protein L29 [Clostridiales bacterium]